MYKENILDHYKNPRNKVQLESGVQCTEHNPLCGDRITLFVQIEGEMVLDASFMGEGCAISQASASLLTEHLKNTKSTQVSEEVVYELLGIPISHARRSCALLSLKALRGALQ